MKTITLNVVSAGIVLCVAALVCSAARAAAVRTIYLDDDVFTGTGADADYTGAAAVTTAYDSPDDMPPRFAAWLASVDRALGIHSRAYRYEMEFGAAAFTPADIAQFEPIRNDRPYAGLIYVSGALTHVEDEYRSAVTAMTVGVLGSGVIPQVHRRIHRTIGAVPPNGWEHQISQGGELTLRLAHERQWASGVVNFAGERVQWLYRVGAGIGFLTDVSAGVAARFGQFSDPEWRIHTSPVGFSDRGIVNRADRHDWFFYTAVSARVPLYNALLQGQFRDSDVTVPVAGRRHFIPNITVGYVASLPNDRALHYFVRAQRSDVRLADRSDTEVFGGVSLSW